MPEGDEGAELSKVELNASEDDGVDGWYVDDEECRVRVGKREESHKPAEREPDEGDVGAKRPKTEADDLDDESRDDRYTDESLDGVGPRKFLVLPVDDPAGCSNLSFRLSTPSSSLSTGFHSLVWGLFCGRWSNNMVNCADWIQARLVTVTVNILTRYGTNTCPLQLDRIRKERAYLCALWGRGWGATRVFLSKKL